MIPMNPDRALRFNDGVRYLLRDSTWDRDGPSPKERSLNNGVGATQIIPPSSGAASDPTNPAGWPKFDDDLSAARGILFGVALGIGFWSLLGGLLGTFIL